MRRLSALVTGSVAAVVCMALLGCSANAAPPATAEIATCVEQPFRAELHVDARDPRRVWATHYQTGQDVAVRPRPPDLFNFDLRRSTTLLNAAGDVMSFTGEITQSGCFDVLTQTLYIGPADVPDPNRPPN